MIEDEKQKKYERKLEELLRWEASKARQRNTEAERLEKLQRVKEKLLE
jgi:hypothetical protein